MNYEEKTVVKAHPALGAIVPIDKLANTMISFSRPVNIESVTNTANYSLAGSAGDRCEIKSITYDYACQVTNTVKLNIGLKTGQTELGTGPVYVLLNPVENPSANIRDTDNTVLAGNFGNKSFTVSYNGPGISSAEPAGGSFISDFNASFPSGFLYINFTDRVVNQADTADLTLANFTLTASLNKSNPANPDPILQSVTKVSDQQYRLTLSNISGLEATGSLTIELQNISDIYHNALMGSGTITYSIDTVNTHIKSISSKSAGKSYKASTPIDITVEYSRLVTLNGTLRAHLNSGGSWEFTDNGSVSTMEISGTYIVAAGNNTPHGIYLDVNSIELVSGTFRDSRGVDVMPAPIESNISASKQIIIDTVPPSVNITSTCTSPTNKYPIPVRLVISDNTSGLADFSTGDLQTIINTNKGNCHDVTDLSEDTAARTAYSRTYNFHVVPSSRGIVTVGFPAGRVHDRADNANSAAESFSIEYDNVPPVVTIISPASGENVKGSTPVVFKVTKGKAQATLNDKDWVDVKSGMTILSDIPGWFIKLSLADNATGGTAPSLSVDGTTSTRTLYLVIRATDSAGNTGDAMIILYSDSCPVGFQITQHGITWHFDKYYTSGRFINGDYWVVGPVSISSIEPATVTVSGRAMNGSMVNPSPLAGTTQGYDSAYSFLVYDSSFNVALNVSSSNPLFLDTGLSLVSTVSKTNIGEPRTILQSAAILTVLDSVPSEGSFRPAYCGTDKSIKYNAKDLDLSLLQELEPVSYTPSMESVENYFERPWLDHVPGMAGEFIHPSDNMQFYGRDMANQVGIAALMLHLNFTVGEKMKLLVRFVQLGIDNYGIIQNDGIKNWEPVGGIASGRKWPILFAGLMLNDKGMQGIGQKSGDYLYSESTWPDNLPSDYIHFGEDGQTFYVTQADVDRTNSSLWKPDERNGTPEPYKISDIELAEWGAEHAINPYKDNMAWSAFCRNVCAIAWSGFVLAARIMGDRDLWNHNALFDYQDRYMAITAEPINSPSWRTSVPGMNDIWGTYPGYRSLDKFTAEMWDLYRDIY